jgi:uncharacterized damage-inducible protein DinB
LLQTIRMLPRYASWANDRLYETLADLPGHELKKPHPIVIGSILRILNHVYANGERQLHLCAPRSAAYGAGDCLSSGCGWDFLSWRRRKREKEREV